MPSTPWPPKGWKLVDNLRDAIGDEEADKLLPAVGDLVRDTKHGNQFHLMSISQGSGIHNLGGTPTRGVTKWTFRIEGTTFHAGPFLSWQMALVRANQEVKRFGGWA